MKQNENNKESPIKEGTRLLDAKGWQELLEQTSAIFNTCLFYFK